MYSLRQHSQKLSKFIQDGDVCYVRVDPLCRNVIDDRFRRLFFLTTLSVQVNAVEYLSQNFFIEIEILLSHSFPTKLFFNIKTSCFH